MTTAINTDTSEAVSLSTALREQTRIVHERAETSPYVQQLLGGALPLAAYTALVAQNYAIYQALEAIGESWRGDLVAGPFVLDELTRVPQLEADLAQLLGPDWRAAADQLRVPATDRYAAHVRAVCAQEPAGFIAHHYVRYLGDLSGGQVVGQAVERIYGEDGQRSASFYSFDRIKKIKPFRDRYRELLDQAPLSPEQRALAVAEAVTAFELNRAVFLDLGDQHQPPNGTGSTEAGSA